MYLWGFGCLLRLALLFWTTNSLDMALFSGPCKNNCVSNACSHHSGSKGGWSPVSLVLVCCVQSTCQREGLGWGWAHFVILKHRGWQFPLLQQSPQLWNTSNWLLTVIAFGSAYFEVRKPVYLVTLRSDSRQNCSVSQASLARPRKKKRFLLLVGFSCKNEIFPQFPKGFGLKCSWRVVTIC